MIVIDSDGEDAFVVTSILIRTGPQAYGAEGYQYLNVISLEIDGSEFETFTSNLTAPIGGYGVEESADLMGTPISRNNELALEAEKGGNFPFQIVADGDGSYDIRVTLFCRADDFDLDIDAVRVSGWKPASDNVTVTYIPGQ
jgi:hypothetical protein